MSSGEAKPFATKISPKLITTLFCHSLLGPPPQPRRDLTSQRVLNCMALVSAELRIRARLPIGARECDCRETGSNAVQTDTFRGNHVAMTSDLSLSGRRIVIT